MVLPSDIETVGESASFHASYKSVQRNQTTNSENDEKSRDEDLKIRVQFWDCPSRSTGMCYTFFRGREAVLDGI